MSRNSSNILARGKALDELLPLVILLSIIPVRETPSSRSSSVFLRQELVIYLKLMSVDWRVPRIAASLALVRRLSTVSVGLTTISDRLQNCLFLRIISEHGLVPKSHSGSLRPLRPACFVADSRLKIPRSPDFDS